jgi:hypothetical protein
MFNAFFAALSFADIGTLALVTFAANEIAALLYAVAGMLKAPSEYRFSALCATYLWRSLIFSDAWKAHKKVTNVPVKSCALFIGTGIFLGLGHFGIGTMLAAFGLAALCAVSFTGAAHLMLLACAAPYRKAHRRAKKMQDYIQSRA